MTPVKALLIAAAFALVPLGASFEPANAGSGSYGTDRTVCHWYRGKAMAAGRDQLYEEAEHYWHLYRQCLRYRIH